MSADRDVNAELDAALAEDDGGEEKGGWYRIADREQDPAKQGAFAAHHVRRIAATRAVAQAQIGAADYEIGVAQRKGLRRQFD